MKQFKSLQELWAYCMYCPICKEMSRDVKVSIGPDYKFYLNKFYLNCCGKIGKILSVNTKYLFLNELGNDVKCFLQFSIDCENNTFSLHSFDMNFGESFYKSVGGYIYFNASCTMCDSTIFSKDIYFYDQLFDISNIKVESENYLLNNDVEEFFISLHHESKKMDIYRKNIFNHENEYKKPVTCELFDLDFNNLEKTIKRLKTIVVFS